MKILEYHVFTEEPAPYEYSRTYSQFENDLNTKEFDLITMDDGKRSQYKACKMLEERGIKAVLGIITSQVGEKGYLTWDELRELSKYHIIASHSHNHIRFNWMKKKQIEAEMYVSRAILEDKLGVEVKYLIPPFNMVNEEVEELAKEYNYELITGRITIRNNTD